MDQWTVALVVVGGAVLLLGLVDALQSRDQRKKVPHEPAEQQCNDADSQSSIPRLKLVYISVYALVMTADWLQGPFVYSLYHDEYDYSIQLVAALFVCGFLSAGCSAPFIGDFADRFGRRLLCLSFTVLYTLSCLTKLIRPLPSLFLGRILGGLSTSILFSSFESWLVTEAHSRGMPQQELDAFLGRLTLVNGAMACVAGVVSDVVVSRYETFKAPFVASAICLVLAFFAISCTWVENYGEARCTDGKHEQQRRWTHLAEGLKVIWRDSSLLSLNAVITLYEGSMYLMVFLWAPTLLNTLPQGSDTLPLGVIFSSFMVAMSGGSVAYNLLLASYSRASAGPADPAARIATAGDETTSLLNSSTADDSIVRSIRFKSTLSSFVCLLAGCMLLGSNFVSSAWSKAVLFTAFEVTVGMYYPTVASLRSAIIPAEHRATITALFRVPLNLLVTLALLCGLDDRPKLAFSLCFAMLLFASLFSLKIASRRR